MVQVILAKQSIKEIPVTYRERNEVKITKDFISTAVLALKMILMISLRIKSFF